MARKGQVAWNKGKPNLLMLGNKYAQGKPSWNKGKKLTEKHIERLRISHLGLNKKENHWNWKGGISRNPYPPEFHDELKLRIRVRDNFTCVLCCRTEREELEELNRVLCVNHIDFNKNNCVDDNLNTLCVRCNVKINREREYWADYFVKKYG